MDVKAHIEGIDELSYEYEKAMLDAMTVVGYEAVQYAKEHGNYRDRTGNLRSSNKYRATKQGLELYNTAEYASDVEQKGYDVLSGAALYAEKRLKEAFEE